MRRKPARHFRDLIVWQKSHLFVLSIYSLSEGFPKSEMYGLTSQLRRAAISILANIAEGFKKRSQLDKARFMNIAQGSIEECKYFLILAKDLGYGDTTKLSGQISEVSKLLESLIRSIRNTEY